MEMCYFETLVSNQNVYIVLFFFYTFSFYTHTDPEGQCIVYSSTGVCVFEVNTMHCIFSLQINICLNGSSFRSESWSVLDPRSSPVK